MITNEQVTTSVDRQLAHFLPDDEDRRAALRPEMLAAGLEIAARRNGTGR